MNDIKVSVNLGVFTIAVLVWLIIGALKVYGVGIPDDISTIFAILTGVILTIVQGFERGVTFTGTTETISEKKTTIVTDKPKGDLPDAKIDDVPSASRSAM